MNCQACNTIYTTTHGDAICSLCWHDKTVVISIKDIQKYYHVKASDLQIAGIKSVTVNQKTKYLVRDVDKYTYNMIKYLPVEDKDRIAYTKQQDRLGSLRQNCAQIEEKRDAIYKYVVHLLPKYGITMTEPKSNYIKKLVKKYGSDTSESDAAISIQIVEEISGLIKEPSGIKTMHAPQPVHNLTPEKEFRKAVLDNRIAKANFPKKYRYVITSTSAYSDYIEYGNHSIEYVMENIQMAIYRAKISAMRKKQLDTELVKKGIPANPTVYDRYINMDPAFNDKTIDDIVCQLAVMSECCKKN